MTKFRLMTGPAARAVGILEPQLADLDRRGKIDPKPVVLGGRRMWDEDQVRQAARHLELLTPEIDRAITAAFTAEGVTNG